ncbi:unnamed protein product [Caenorhabditis bovis]|uniref:DUF676 domain-containing protein n=1 Tax=Caenorhabditis bovis TaxID=2654633 RepID=A0A8S1F3L5_9PELO|nr:unnamed protein product [Caenorhabditis bovis]
MRIELHPLFNVNLVLGDFFNVELEERGYYQIRVVPKNSSEFFSLEIVRDGDETQTARQSNRTGSPRSPNDLMPACVQNGVGISQTIEITYVDEVYNLEDSFCIAVQLQATTNFNEVRFLDVDLEIWFMDRYRPPRHELFQKLAKQQIRIPLDATRLCSAARSLYFECVNVGALTMSLHASLVMMATRRRKPSPDTPLAKNSKLKKYHSAACETLLNATKSIEEFIKNHASLIKTTVSMDEIDVELELKALAANLEIADAPWIRLETDCSELSSRLTLIYQQMLILLGKSAEIRAQLLADYDKQRRGVLSEAFFCIDKPKNEVIYSMAVNYTELFAIIAKAKYLQMLPRPTIFCADADSPSNLCSVVFEECFSVAETPEPKRDACKPSTASAAIAISSSTSSARKSGSFTDRLKREASKSLRMIAPRRKSADSAQLRAAKRRDIPKSRTSTAPSVETLVLRDADELLGRASAAGNAVSCVPASQSDDDEIGNIEKMSRLEVIEALRPSSSADDVTQVGSSESQLRQVHSRDMIKTVEFVRAREALKSKLAQKRYDGWLYSERAMRATPPLQTSPLCVESLKEIRQTGGNESTRTHLVVFVHGLEGSHEDLLPYKCALRQAINSHYYSMFRDGAHENDAPYRVQYLMSRANHSETWANIKTMAHNLLCEIREFVEEYPGSVHRISFVGHSLGGVIVRSAVGVCKEVAMGWLIGKLHTLLTINTPHLGLAYVGRHVHIGMQFVKWWKRSESIEQLALRDSLNFTQSFLYELSANDALAQFRNVLMIGSPDDMFVPSCSALLEPSRHSIRDLSALGSAYREMLSNLLSSIVKSEKTKNFVRYVTFHQIPTASSNRLTGRAGHIAAVEDVVFIEKLFSVSAVKYFV